MKNLSILGSTGSIGQQALDVVARHPERFSVLGLAEGHDVDLFSHQIEKFRPQLVSVRNEESAKKLLGLFKSHRPEIMCGVEGASAVASMAGADLVVSAIVGAAGLVPTIAALNAGKVIALANKETMVIAGELVREIAKKSGSKIIPVDSEHSAIHQSLEGHNRKDVVRILLTASGGPFLRWGMGELERATPEAALKHPRWSMGTKITIDSATLMNKGLEVIEARWLFDVSSSAIRVLIHPQSIVHSMVEYVDGCVIAELGVPDMRAPIAYAMAYPERVASGVESLDLIKIGTLSFEEPDMEKFPCLSLAYDALEAARSMPCVLNAANEVAVEAFAGRKIGFMDIARIVRKTMDGHEPRQFSTVDEILEIDRWARAKAQSLC